MHLHQHTSVTQSLWPAHSVVWTRVMTCSHPSLGPYCPALLFLVFCPTNSGAVTSLDSELHLLSSESSHVPLRFPFLCGGPETLSRQPAVATTGLIHSSSLGGRCPLSPDGQCLEPLLRDFVCFCLALVSRAGAGWGVSPSLLLLLGQKRSLFLSSCFDVILSQQSTCRYIRSLVARTKSLLIHTTEKNR